MGDLHLAFLADRAEVAERAQWRNPDLMALWGATHASAVEGVDVAISAWIAGGRYRVVGKELSGTEGKLHGGLVSAAEGSELNDWKTFRVSHPLKGGAPLEAIVDTRRLFTWETVDGEKDARARLVAQGYQGSDLKDGIVDAPGIEGRHSSDLRVKMEHSEPGHQECFSSGGWLWSRNFSPRSCGMRSRGLSLYLEVACAGVWPGGIL